LAKALEHPDSRRRFVTVNSEKDLASMLDAPLEKWRVFLHPSQERLVTKNFNGPARVLGGPGTGKTVVAMHRARHLAKTLCSDADDRILFTTYTANLAQNVEQNIRD
jgi:superfamily I DNA and RNA helicase